MYDFLIISTQILADICYIFWGKEINNVLNTWVHDHYKRKHWNSLHLHMQPKHIEHQQ